MTKHQVLMLKRHLKVVSAAYEQMLNRADNSVSEKALITEALEDARAMLVELERVSTSD